MKTKRNTKKLFFNKQVIANLNTTSLSQVKGGDSDEGGKCDTCTKVLSVCCGITLTLIHCKMYFPFIYLGRPVETNTNFVTETINTRVINPSR